MKLRSLVALLVGCTPVPPETDDTTGCVPELPDPTRARAKQVVCSDEAIDGIAQRGDWLLQSSGLTVYIRTERFALSKPGRAGGTLIDFHPTDGAVELEELVPLLPQADGTLDWFVDIDIHAFEDNLGAGIVVNGVLPDGTPGEVTWRLAHEGRRLEIEGADTFDVVPLANAALRADLMSYGDRLVGPGTITEDLGGWFRLTGTTWLEHASEATLPELLPDRYIQPIAGACPDGELIYLRNADGRVSQRIGITDAQGEFDFLGDDRATEIICLASSRASSGWQPLPDWEAGDESPEPTVLAVGDLGELSVHVTDPSGNPVPSTVWWNSSRYFMGLGEGTMGVGAGVGDGLVGAGPAWSTAALPEQDVGEDSTTRAVIRRVLPDEVLLADFFIEAWPHRTTRTPASTQVARRVSSGVEWSVTVGDHAVVATDVYALDRDEMWSHSGARAPTPHGTIVSWPWSHNNKANQWGAPDTTGLGPHEALAVMGGGRGLTTIVDTAWVDSAGPPHTWPVVPDGLYITSLDDLPVYFELLDHWTNLPLVGPLTWVEGVDRRTMPFVEAERAFELGRTMATTGPLVRLRVGDTSIGAEHIAGGPRTARLAVQAPTWMPVDHVALVGPDGVVREWTLGSALDVERLNVETDLPEGIPWVVAMAWSDRTAPPLQEVPPWTVTTAILLERP